MAKEDQEQIIERLDLLLQRIERLETYLGIPFEAGSELPSKPAREDAGTRLELNVGEYGLAWAGSIILFLGIIFLTLFTYRQGHVMVANLLAYTTAGILFALSRYWRKTITHFSRLMAVGTTVFLFYATTRLHFFTEHPVLNNPALVIALLTPIVALQFYWTLSYDFAPFALLAVLLGVGAALLADHFVITPLMITIVFVPAVFIATRKRWFTISLISMLLVYGGEVLWILNNPWAGHPIQLSPFRISNVPFLFVISAISIAPLLRNQAEWIIHPFTIVTLILNCLLFSLLTVGSFFEEPEKMAIVSLAAATFLISTSVMQWKLKHLELPAAFIASFGFLSLSISIGIHQPFPYAFILLALQSLLVLSMSLWFRSKSLVVINSMIYCGILVLYLAVSPVSHLATFLFALVALISARILNWKKERLTLQTGALRNLYLGIAFVLILYGLYTAVPREYVTLSWTAAAVCYFFLSYLLKNVKYRWMGTLAVIVTVFYLLIVDLPRLSMTYRIIAFLFLGLMALLISLFYTRLRRLLGRRS